MIEQRSHLYGVIGEFATPKQVLEAARKKRDAGYKDIDAFSPYPLE